MGKREDFSLSAHKIQFAKKELWYVLFCVPKENQKSRFEKLGGGEAIKAPAGLLCRRPVCKANAARLARQGRGHESGAPRP